MTIAQGIHHITAIGSDPQKLVDFYTQLLGLRLVKKTVNQDDVSAYHLFFGDTTGEPGMDLTFFTFPGAQQGTRGRGQVTTISLAVPGASLPFWQQRFDQLGVKHEGVTRLLDLDRITFYDFDDQCLELVAVPDLAETGELWTTPEVSADHAIRAFHSARLTVTSKSSVEGILDGLGYKHIKDEGERSLFQLPGQQRAAFLEVEAAPDQPMGYNAVGTVHHIAFGAADEAAQAALREQMIALGQRPTEVIDRFYFKSVYYRIPAGILFEIATMGPGFTADEDNATLGERLSLPPFLEPHRAQIEAGLVPVNSSAK